MNYIKYSLSFFCLLLMFVMTSDKALAGHSPEKAYGYFSSLVEYVDDSSSCDWDEVSFEVWLVNPNTKTPVSGSVGDWWWIDIRDIDNDYSYLRTNWVGVDDKTSDRFCFDIDNESMDIGIYDSPDYHFLGTVAVNFRNLTQASRDEMKGRHFRGYVELASFSETTPYVEALFPTYYTTSYLPDFQIRVNTISNIYNATSLRKAGIYFENDDYSLKYQLDVDDYGGVGDRYVPFPIEVDDGWYYWTPLVQLDGYVEAQKTSWPQHTWYFTGTPFYGLADMPYFGIDRTEPTAVFNSVTITSTTENEATVEVDHTAEDAMLGVATTTFYVIDVAASSTDAEVLEYTANYLYSVNEVVSFNNLEKGKTYGFYTVTKDWVLNTFTSPITYLTIPDNPTVIDPTFSNVDYTSADLGATVDSDGGSPVTDRGTCFDVIDTFASESCASQGSGLGIFTHLRDSMPDNTVIYFRGYAQNAVGTGYSTTSTFATLGYGPIISNLGADSLTLTGANLRADITSKNGSDIKEHGFCWNEGGSYNPSAPTHQCQWFGAGVEGSFSYGLSGLVADTTYSYVASAENDADTSTSTISTFTTLRLPQVALDPVSNITTNGADLNATLTDGGSDPVTSHGFCWNEGSTYNSVSANCNPDLGSISSGSSFTHALAPLLSPNTTYSFIAYAESVAGRVETGELQFDTHSPIPTVTLTATPSTINAGYSATLDWISADATSCSSPNFNTGGATSGSVTVSPASDTIYNITCSGPGGDGSDTADITVNTGPPVLTDPEIELSSVAELVRSGDSTQLEWKMNNVTEPLECEITGPSTFNFSFSHPTDTATSDPEITGTVDSGQLYSTQTFTFTCVDNISAVTYSTSTKVKVIGNSFET